MTRPRVAGASILEQASATSSWLSATSGRSLRAPLEVLLDSCRAGRTPLTGLAQQPGEAVAADAECAGWVELCESSVTYGATSSRKRGRSGKREDGSRTALPVEGGSVTGETNRARLHRECNRRASRHPCCRRRHDRARGVDLDPRPVVEGRRCESVDRALPTESSEPLSHSSVLRPPQMQGRPPSRRDASRTSKPRNS